VNCDHTADNRHCRNAPTRKVVYVVRNWSSTLRCCAFLSDWRTTVPYPCMHDDTFIPIFIYRRVRLTGSPTRVFIHFGPRHILHNLVSSRLDLACGIVCMHSVLHLGFVRFRILRSFAAAILVESTLTYHRLTRKLNLGCLN
jgi:hypothetical protein